MSRHVIHVNGSTRSWINQLPHISVDSPWHRIGIDLIGPLPRTVLGNIYIITCTDFFTKWPEASAIADKAALTVASFLFKLITRHGSPVIIQSDQGREFVGDMIACDKCGDWYHMECVGLKRPPPKQEQWNCNKCSV